MNIAVHVFNPFQENTYVVADETGQCVVIDAGNYSEAENKKLQEYLKSRNLNPVLALNTHGHVDHILGVQFLKDAFGIKFALHGDDKFLVDSAPEQGRMFGFEVENIPSVDIDIKDLKEIKFGNTTFQIIHTPGHSPGHVCFYHPENKILFSGDTLFRESIGRTDLPGGDYSWIMKSILQKLIPLGGDVKIYPGHGPHSSIGYELLYNPFITEVINNEVSY